MKRLLLLATLLTACRRAPQPPAVDLPAVPTEPAGSARAASEPPPAGSDRAAPEPPPAGSARAAPEPPPAGSARTPRELSRAVLDRMCHAENADGTSHVFIGRDAKGNVIRYTVTPRTSLADAGLLYFDRNGKFLGHGMGSEMFMSPSVKELQEQERQLEAGATFTEGPRCNP